MARYVRSTPSSSSLPELLPKGAPGHGYPRTKWLQTPRSRADLLRGPSPVITPVTESFGQLHDIQIRVYLRTFGVKPYHPCVRGTVRVRHTPPRTRTNPGCISETTLPPLVPTSMGSGGKDALSIEPHASEDCPDGAVWHR